jgi:hypothetical protein
LRFHIKRGEGRGGLSPCLLIPSFLFRLEGFLPIFPFRPENRLLYFVKEIRKECKICRGVVGCVSTERIKVELYFVGIGGSGCSFRYKGSAPAVIADFTSLTVLGS